METSRLTLLFCSACFLVELWVQTPYARESPIGLFIRFLCQPFRGLSGVCGVEQRVSVNDHHQEMREHANDAKDGRAAAVRD
jgi:hypothetical protein